jgi:hypothetical protein
MPPSDAEAYQQVVRSLWALVLRLRTVDVHILRAMGTKQEQHDVSDPEQPHVRVTQYVTVSPDARLFDMVEHLQRVIALYMIQDR